jgi:rare lipoprotein A
MRRVSLVMRRTFSMGALALLLSGNALAPAMVNTAKAATQAGPADDDARKAPVSGTEVAIREVDSLTPDADPAPVLPQPIAPAPSGPRVLGVSKGEASWYGPGFFGNRTASGEVLRPGTLTAAHRSLPFGTRVRVTNLLNGRQAVVRINDRGPFYGARVIDLAHGAADQLGLTASGVARVKLEVLR